METNHVIRTQSLSRAFGDTQAARQLRLDAQQCEILTLTGSNGAGKSVTISMPACLLKLAGAFAWVGATRYLGRPEEEGHSPEGQALSSARLVFKPRRSSGWAWLIAIALLAGRITCALCGRPFKGNTHCPDKEHPTVRHSYVCAGKDASRNAYINGKRNQPC